MIGSGRTIGLSLIAAGGTLLLLFIVWMLTSLNAAEMTSSGFTLGVVLAAAIAAPIVGIGLYMFRKGTAESTQFADVQQQKKILNMVLAQGKVTIAELIIELQLPRDSIEDMIRDLVGKKLFSGAINWDKGVLYSKESQLLVKDQKCPNCGGELTFAGKGIIVCPYCGSEIFLTQKAEKIVSE